MAPGAAMMRLDGGRQLRFRPNDAVDAKVLTQAVAATDRPQKVVPGHEADRFGRPEALRNRTGDDIHLVEAGAGDDEVRRFHVGAAKHVRARSASRG